MTNYIDLIVILKDNYSLQCMLCDDDGDDVPTSPNDNSFVLDLSMKTEEENFKKKSSK